MRWRFDNRTTSTSTSISTSTMTDIISFRFSSTANSSMDTSFRRSSLTSSKRCSIKRLSKQLSGSLSLIPYSRAEWHKLMAEVKKDYSNRRYRQCVARCSEVLDHIRDPRSLEPAYLVYLHFYAACALELQGRSLHHAAPSRTALLEQASWHYNQASGLIKAAEAAIKQPCSPQRRPPSGCPTLVHSPTSSISSIASSRLSRPSSISPAPSSGSSSFQRSASRRRKCTIIDQVPHEPIVRPDSPTLGFDDFLNCSSPDLISAMPQPPTTIPLLLPSPFSKHEPETLEAESPPPFAAAAAIEFIDPFLRARSIHRYCTLLTGMQRQINRHIAFTDEDLAVATGDDAPPVAPPSNNKELRALELQTRIERLRANGWQRKRFDVQRYEALRESAMADMLE